MRLQFSRTTNHEAELNPEPELRPPSVSATPPLARRRTADGVTIRLRFARSTPACQNYRDELISSNGGGGMRNYKNKARLASTARVYGLKIEATSLALKDRHHPYSITHTAGAFASLPHT